MRFLWKLPLLVLLHEQEVSCEILKVGGVIQFSGVGASAKAAFELWRDWVNARNLGYTVVLQWTEYTNGMSDAEFVTAVKDFVDPGTVHAFVTPYSTDLTKQAVEAVPSGSSIPILCWGGALESIFTESCVGRNCFSGMTAASEYIPPTLRRLVSKYHPLTIGLITNADAFSMAVSEGARALIESHSKLRLIRDHALSVVGTNLTQSDIAGVQELVADEPDVVIIAGHPGDVEPVIWTVRTQATFHPLAIIANNAFTNLQAYPDLGAVDNVIMPTQWAEDPTMADSIFRWDSQTFTAAMAQKGVTASYQSAAAGALAILLSHAMAAAVNPSNPFQGVRTEGLATLLQDLDATETFYGVMDWAADGSLRADLKPVYGLQRQDFDWVVVAPTGASMIYPMGLMPTLGVTEPPSSPDMQAGAKGRPQGLWPLLSAFLPWLARCI